jgi:hypothetical protein
MTLRKLREATHAYQLKFEVMMDNPASGTSIETAFYGP